MFFTHVLAVAPVSDFESAVLWYERLMGRPADARPMDGLADWHVSPSAWVQVFRSPEHAGTTLLNLVVDDLDQALDELAGRGIAAGEVQPGAEKVRFAAVHDPDGNRVTLVENPVA
ncbi:MULTISPECIES: VOC family protein [unclassified Streptomyces]|uniref:VOC family protein n=1 Tax=unclassified Streptomyces TaxID=2593676 RepID=UPI002E34406C|nr:MULTISPECIES: VOC family protein [unclassified Streptomyces]WUC67644.1 VOC family protein [Streptomyces sp. NBC_00539]